MTRMSGSRYSRPFLLLVVTAAAVALAVPSAGLAAAHPAGRPGPASGTSAAHFPKAGLLDCNGHSPIQHPIKIGGYICAEVHGGPHNGHLEDNGYYIGHDEPTVQFYSNKPGSSNNVSYVQTLP
jgi:hypothetical protein